MKIKAKVTQILHALATKSPTSAGLRKPKKTGNSEVSR